jgi:undecaprenyl diphosphate synthase
VVAIVMDGNGRWAEARGLDVAEGHRAGTRALRRTVEAAVDLGLDALVVYAFSTENWARPADEVADLMELLSQTIDGELPDLAKQGVRTRFLGRRDRLEPWLEAKMAALERSTAHLDTLDLWIAFDYGGRAEIAHAARRLAEDGLEPAQIDENALAARLYAPEVADIDLLVRTSGELRLSNFMLWEVAYAELVFTETLWPDFGEDDLRAALDAYAARQRRFGARTAT